MASAVLEWNKNYLLYKLGGSLRYFDAAERMSMAFASLLNNVDLVKCSGALWMDLIKLQLHMEYPLTSPNLVYPVSIKNHLVAG